MTDRAQAETLGFATVFGLVAFMVLAVSLTVYPAISDVSAHQRVSNVEEGMASLADNVDEVVRNDAPSRSTRLRLDGGQLALGDPEQLTISGQNATGPFSETYTVRPLVYRSGEGTDLVYANGAVFRAEDGGVAVVHEPRMVVSGDRVVLPVVRLRQGDGPSGVAGTTRVATTASDRRVALAETMSSDVTLTVDSPRAPGWRRVLEAQGMTCSASPPDTVTCTRDTDHVHVTVVEVEVAFR